MRVLKAIVRLVAVVVVAGIGTAAVAVAAAPQIAKIVTAHDSTSSLPPLRGLDQQSFMFDASGALLAELKDVVDRQVVPLEQVPVGVRDAIIAVEDEGFYLHKGVSLKSLVRATLSNVSAGEITQGGSTITQQVVKNLILTDAETADRKVTEAMYATRLEKQLTKDQILEQYLNLVYLGNGAYGVQAGAKVYFDKDVRDLTIEEGAFLAGMIRNPTQYDPFRYPDRSTARWKLALSRLVDVDRLTPAQYDAAVAAMMLPARRYTRDLPADTYFVGTVKDALLNGTIPEAVFFGADKDTRTRNLFYGGFKIYTTFDPTLQQMAEDSYNEVLPADRGDTDAALVSLDPNTGAVKAMVGGPGFANWQYNLAVQGNRQPGSSFKTFVLVAALEAGVLPEDKIDGIDPCTFPNPGGDPDPYPVNASGNGINTIASMTAKSTNCAFVRLGQIVGLQRVIDIAKKMGIRSPIFDEPEAPKILSMPLGTLEVSPIDMASAYGVLAAQGAKHGTHYITRIEDANGSVIYDRGSPAPDQVLTKDTALRATETLEGVITGGTGRANARLADGRPAAGKTGTAEDNGDAWFVGYTPQLVTAVWVGHKKDRFEVILPGFGRVQGGNAPAKLWSTFMNKAMSQYEVLDFEDPPPSPRRPARVYLPGGECGSVVDDAEVPWSTVERKEDGRTRIDYVAAIDLRAPVPSVAEGGLVYDCRRGPPTTAPAPVATNPDGTPIITLPGGEPAPTTPPPGDGTPPSSEDTGGGDG